MSDFDRRLGIFFKGRHKVWLMSFVILGDFGEIIEKPVFNHEETSVTEDARFATFLDNL